jgi:adenine-specific DNA-methyltransferase
MSTEMIVNWRVPQSLKMPELLVADRNGVGYDRSESMITATMQSAAESAVMLSERDRRHELGQFLTADPVADFMASLFEGHYENVTLLDAGAGSGALSAALVRRLCGYHRKPKRIAITAFELDGTLLEALHRTLDSCQEICSRASVEFSASVRHEDFIASIVPSVRGDLFAPSRPQFNMAIVNPPYRKIRSDSETRHLLRSAGIETSNLYTGFVALITKLLMNRGELVAITPRSFCNGPYFKPFRTDFLASMSLRRLHVFESRSAAFSRDAVLQENIIFHAVKGEPKPERVIISSSSGVAGSRVSERTLGYTDVVSPTDPEQFIHLSDRDDHDRARAAISSLSASLSGVGVSVSTGRVVDFRAKEFLRQQAEPGTVPLIYPCHFNRGFVHWPKEGARKPNAIVSNEATGDLLVPTGVYVLVKRFTAKEERKRIVACIFDPKRITAHLIGFENHVNYFHMDGHGLPMRLALGLAAFLNSTVVDMYFRQFNGHTQVNATDLRSLKYPSREELERLGERVGDPGIPQAELDSIVEEALF